MPQSIVLLPVSMFCSTVCVKMFTAERARTERQRCYWLACRGNFQSCVCIKLADFKSKLFGGLQVASQVALAPGLGGGLSFYSMG